MLKLFKVGGCVRDGLLGVHTKDIDFSVVLDDTNQTVDQGWDIMLTFLKDQGFKVFLKTKDCFTVRAMFPKGHQHQGLVAEVEHLEKIILKEFIKKNSDKKNITLVILEDVTDPRNIGSIIRNAASFNIDGIIVKERSFPSESKLLYKSASGCLELINIFETSNINTTIKYLKSKNFWVTGFDLKSNKDFTKHDWNGNNVLLFGSEGSGINYQTKKNSDYLLKININKNVESLNISNSTSVVFHFLDLFRKKNID